MKSKFVNEFCVGDGISILGWHGTVTDVHHWKSTDGRPGTYVTVHFDDPKKIGYQYEGGDYGGLDNVVSYGYFER